MTWMWRGIQVVLCRAEDSVMQPSSVCHSDAGLWDPVLLDDWLCGPGRNCVASREDGW